MTPKIPAAASTSAKTPNRPKSQVRKRGCAIEASTRADTGSTSVTGRLESMLRTSRRMEAATLAGLMALRTTTSPPQSGACANGTYIMGPGHIAHDADDLSPDVLIRREPEHEFPSNGILIGEIALGQ